MKLPMIIWWWCENCGQLNSVKRTSCFMCGHVCWAYKGDIEEDKDVGYYGRGMALLQMQSSKPAIG